MTEQLLSKRLNPYELAMQNFEMAADVLELEADIRAMVRAPERVLAVTVPVRMDNGKMSCFEGYRVQHNTSRGPAKGEFAFTRA